ncbi:Uncharacterized protein FKW44_018525, partial [Caligus rogercresseyi]
EIEGSKWRTQCLPLSPIIIMKNRFTDSHQKWFRYRLSTSSLFMSKSRADPSKR